MRRHPSVEKAIEIASRFGFISKDIYWNHISQAQQTMTYRLWNRLTEEGLFIPLDSTLKGQFLKLSQLGRSIALKQRLMPVSPPILQQLSHDELILKLALALENKDLIQKSMPEVYYKSSSLFFSKSFSGPQRKIPDLYFSLNLPYKKIRVAAEYERTRKTESRYRSILMNYASFKEVDLVLFIVNDVLIEKTLRQVAKKVHYPIQNRPLAFALATDVESNLTDFQIRFQNRAVEFSSFVQEMKQMMKEAS